MDRETLEKAKALIATRESVTQSLIKMEEKKADVKPAVYQKVKTDYDNRLSECKKELAATLPGILARGQGLERTLGALAKNQEELSEVEDELVLRHHIGETPDGEFNKKSAEIKKKREQMKGEQDGAGKELGDILGVCRQEPGFGDINPNPGPTPAGASAAAVDARRAPTPPAPTAPPTAPLPAPPASKEMIEEALGDPFAEVSGAAGAPDKPFFTNPTLIVKSKGEETSYLLDLGEVAIGKAPDNDIVLNEENALPKHAIVRFEQDHYTVISLAGDGQLLVNDKSMRRAPLNDGDRVRIGRSEITFRNVRYEYDV
ncbi:MAG: FHA domain-containing protein [Acidobacteriota bacterium]